MAGALQGPDLRERVSDFQPRIEPAAVTAKGRVSMGNQYYFATERGREGYVIDRHDFAKLIWQTGFAAMGFR